MPTVQVYDAKREKVGQVELSEAVFATEIKNHLLHEVVTWQLACRRSGTAKTKSWGDTSGGGSKPWRQKGTGRARSGSRRNPLWKGGATLFGPTPRDYSYTVPKKVRKAALRSALSSKLQEEKLVILRGFDLTEIKTKAMVEILDRFETQDVLIIIDQPDLLVEKSSHNLPKVKVMRAAGLNVYDILRYDRLMLLEQAVKPIEEALS